MFVNGSFPPIMNDFFSFTRIPYNLSTCIPTIKKLKYELNLLHTGDQRYGILFQKA